jgi:hypothetical protein
MTLTFVMPEVTCRVEVGESSTGNQVVSQKTTAPDAESPAWDVDVTQVAAEVRVRLGFREESSP